MPFLRGANGSCEVSEDLKGDGIWGASLAQLEKHEPLDLGILSSSPTLGVGITKKER